MLGCSGFLRPQEILISGWEGQNDLHCNVRLARGLWSEKSF